MARGPFRTSSLVRVALFALPVTLGLGLACAEYVVAPSERTPRALQLDSLQYTVDEGQQLPIVATVLDQFGAPFTTLPAGVAVTWASSDSSIVGIDDAGVLDGVAAGTATVTASVTGAFGAFDLSADVTVRPLLSAMTLVAGDGQSGTVGQALPTRLTVRVTNRLGAGVKGIAITFTSTAGGGTFDTATVVSDSTGTASAGYTLGTVAGTNTVTAGTPRLPGVTVTFTAQGTPAPLNALARVSGDGQTAGAGTTLGSQLVVQAVDRYDNGIAGVTVDWAVTSGGGSFTPTSSVTNAQGQASASWKLGAPQGAQTATASTGGGALTVTFSATATLTVATVTVTPAPVTLVSGATQQMTATPKDAGGTTITGRTATWATSDATVATVTAAGLVTAVKVGSATITATIDAVNGTAGVTVTPGAASTATSLVTTSAATVFVGDALTFTLTTKDAAGNGLTSGGATVGFATSGGTSAGTIGAVTDQANGAYTATFTATIAGTPVSVGATINGQPVTTTLPGIQVQVKPDTTVASVTVTPSPVTVPSGTSVQLTATAKNAAGTVLAGKPVSWSSNASGIASVDGNGLVTGALVGGATITATIQGVNGTATVTVTPGAASTTTSVVTTSAATVFVGNTLTFTLTAKDAAGNSLTSGGATVTFTTSGGTSAGTLGTVADQGNGTYTATFTATVAGTPVSVGATIAGQPVTTTLPTVQVQVDTTVTSVTVAPPSATIPAGTTVQLAATAKNAEGAVLSGNAVTWSSDAPTIAGVDVNGLVTGGLVGTATITATVQGVNGTATITVIVGAVSTTRSTVSVAPSTLAVGDTATLTLTTRDAGGNLIGSGGRTVVFTQSGGTGAGTITSTTDNGDGTYTAKFIATTAGTPASIGATIDGNAVTSSAPTITVTAPDTHVHWINTAGGSWSDAANWSPARVPTATDTAVIDAPGSYQIDYRGPNVGGITLGDGGAAKPVVQVNIAAVVTGDLHVLPGATFQAFANGVIVGGFLNDGTIEIGSDADLSVDTTGSRTAVNNDTLIIQGDAALGVTRIAQLVNHGLINPGTLGNGTNIGLTTIAGNVALQSGSVINIEIQFTGLREYDVVGITGNAVLGDTLNVTLDPNFQPAIGDTFVVVVWSSFSGSFGTINLPTLTTGQWQVQYTSVGLQLTVVP